MIVDFVISAGRRGLPNIMATPKVRHVCYALKRESQSLQLLKSQLGKRAFDPQVIDNALTHLQACIVSVHISKVPIISFASIEEKTLRSSL
jgi:hypothetical protein